MGQSIITKSDIKKFIYLLKEGVKNGKRKDMKIYSSASTLDGTGVATGYYVSLEFSFMIDPEHIEDLLNEDFIENEIDELFNDK